MKGILMPLCLAVCLILAGCGAAGTESGCGNVSPSGTSPVLENEEKPQLQEHTEESIEDEEMMLRMKIGDIPVDVDWEDNESVKALKDLCQDGPITIRMSMYGGFEQVGSIGQSLPEDDIQMTTQAGDIVLYAGNQIVVFYGSNSWAYTKLGHISGKSAREMAELLGDGAVTILISAGQ